MSLLISLVIHGRWNLVDIVLTGVWRFIMYVRLVLKFVQLVSISEFVFVSRKVFPNLFNYCSISEMLAFECIYILLLWFCV